MTAVNTKYLCIISTQPISTQYYKYSANKYSANLLASKRMAEANTVLMVHAVLPYCFRPAPTAIPSDVLQLCEGLVHKQHSFVEVFEQDPLGRTIKMVRLHHWPSWLRVGSKAIV